MPGYADALEPLETNAPRSVTQAAHRFFPSLIVPLSIFFFFDQGKINTVVRELPLSYGYPD